jgi:hypothetical protein
MKERGGNPVFRERSNVHEKVDCLNNSEANCRDRVAKKREEFRSKIAERGNLGI